MLVAIALLATLLAAWYGHRYWQLAADGAVAPAHSVKVEREPVLGKIAFGDPHRYLASYEYVDDDGRVHAARQTISREVYDKLARGSDGSLTVHYSRSSPDVNVIDMQAARIVPLTLGALAAVTWIAALFRLVRG